MVELLQKFFKSERSGYNQWALRQKISVNFLRLLVDIMMIPPMLLLLFSWRAPILIKKFRGYNLYRSGGNPNKRSRGDTEIYIRKGIMAHFGRYIMDLFILIPVAIVFFSWRCPILILKVIRFFKSNMKVNQENRLRLSILFHAGQVLIDILTIPTIFITLFSWRLPFFCKTFPLNPHKTMARKFKKVRLQFWKEALLFFCDIPVIIAFVVLVCFSWICPWRLYQVITSWGYKDFNFPYTIVGWWVQSYQYSVRIIILRHFLYLCVDVSMGLFVVIIILTGVRIPFFINKLKKQKKSTSTDPSYYKIWIAILKQFALLFVDLVMLVMIAIIFGTLWRIKPMIRKIKKHVKYEDPSKCKDEDEEDEDEDNLDDKSVHSLKISTESNIEIVEMDKLSTAVENDQEIIEESPVKSNEANSTSEIVDDTGKSCVNEMDITNAAPSFWTIFFGIRGWKIRKAICLNIIGLLMDIPAFILLIINVIFIYQIPFIIQRFIECGDFYQEFLYIMVDETNHLLQDIAFFFIFLILTIVRPFSVWVNLFEDEGHLKWKKTTEYLNQLHHIVKFRHKVSAQIQSDLSIFIKYHQLHTSNHDYVQLRLIEDVKVYTSELSDIRDKMLYRNLDDWLFYILANLHFYESKKPYLYYRRYQLEELYCQRACHGARLSNLQMWKEDHRKLDLTLDDYYNQLQDYKPKKVPLWSDKIGFFLRTRKQNQRVIISTITSGYFGIIALFLLNSVFLYRVPVMICNMWKVRYCRYKVRDATLHQTKEYLLDLLAVLKILLVTISIYRCPALLSELTHDLFSKRSMSAARKTADKYPPNILHDLLELYGMIFRWDTVIFAFASILFFIFIPLSLIINTVRGSGVNLVLVFVISVPIYLIVMSSPFIIVHKITDIVMTNTNIPNGTISFILAAYFGFITLLLSAFVIVKTKAQKKEEKVVKSIDYIRFNWFNANLVILEVVELIQLLALVFSLRNMVMPYAADFRTVSQYILLDVYDYRIKFGISTLFFVIWLLVCTIPSLLEGVTKTVPSGHFSKNHFVWRAYLSFFGSTMFVSLPEMNISLLSCKYYQCDNSTICPSLYDDMNTVCWSGSHLIFASMGFIMMVWYVFTALLYCTEYTDVGNKKVDLHFSPPYSSLVSIVKLIIIVGVVLFSEYKLYVLSFVAILFISLILISLTFRNVTGMEICNSKVLLMWRIQVFVVVLLVTLGLIAFEAIDTVESLKQWSVENTILSTSIPLLDVVVPAVVLGLIVICIVFGLILTKYLTSKSEQEVARAKFKTKVLEIIKYLDQSSGFIPHWKKISTAFTRMLGVVRVAHKNDKDFVTPSDDFLIDYNGPAPPGYEDVDPDLVCMPTPPTYKDVATTDPDQEEQDVPSTDGAPEEDDYFLPTMEMYLSPVGNYQEYDAECLSDRIKDGAQTYTALFSAGFTMNSVEERLSAKQLDDSHCTGIDLLLLLEEYISYTSFSYKFIIQAAGWRERVKSSNWVGLHKCLLEMENNLDFKYDKSGSALQAEQKDFILPHVDTSHLPEYVPLRDITQLKLNIHRREVERLMTYLPEPWVHIFRKIIPSSESTTPLIFRVTLGREDESNMWDLRVEMFQEVEIIVRGIDSEGFKMAVGASIVLPNPILISRIRKWNRRINFGSPFPYGKKGMLSRNITSCSCKGKNGIWSLVAAGKSVKLNKVLASLNNLEWKFRD